MRASMRVLLCAILSVATIGSVFAQDIEVSLPDTTGETGTSFTIPISVGDLTGRNVIAYQTVITFDESILDATGASSTGTLSDGFGPPTVNTAIDGQIIIGGFGTAPLDGSGILVNINFEVVGQPGEMTDLEFVSFVFNAGDPPAMLTSGKFTVSGAEPDIAVNPTSHDYGDVIVDSSATQIFVVSNEGAADLDVSATNLTGANADQFNIDSGGAPFMLAPGDSQNVVVSFNPTLDGTKNATLEIVSNDPDEDTLNVALTGNGVLPLVPDIAASADTLDYGDVTVGSSASQTLVVSNEGTAELRVSATDLTGADAAQFNVDSGGAPFTLAPGDTQEIVLSFTSTSEGAKIATLQIDSNDPDEGTVEVALTGNGVPAPAPDIAVNPASHDYGDVPVDSSATQTFVVSNAGTADLIVIETSLTGTDAARFNIDSGGAPFTLAPGDSQDVVVSFNPISEGAKTATLQILSNDTDEDTVNVALTGNGVIPQSDIAVSADTLDFDDVTVGSSASQTLVVKNEGTADLTVSATSLLLGIDTDQFNIDSGGAPFTLAPGDSQELVVSFNPTLDGTKNTTLEIVSNDPDEDTLNVALTGNGVVLQPDIAVSADTLDYGDVTVGSSSSQTLVVKNEGTADLTVSATTLLPGIDTDQFNIDSGGAPFTLAPGDSQNVVVSFNPISEGAKTATLQILSNDTDEDTVNVALTGNGVILQSDIAVSADTLDYGDVTVGLSSTQTLVVKNEGTADLEVSSTSLLPGIDTDQFNIDSGGAPFTLVPGDSQNVVVSFNPTLEGAKSAALEIVSNDPDEDTLSVALTGSGVALSPIETEIVLCLDVSGSIDAIELRIEIDGLKACLNDTSIIPQDGSVAVGIVTFSSSATTRLGLTPVTATSLVNTIEPVLNSLISGGGTNIPAGLQVSQTLLAGGTTNNQFIILTSDGVSSGNVQAACQDVANAGITICSIAIGDGADLVVLENCALRTGGQFGFAPTFNDFLPICEECLTFIFARCRVEITSPPDGSTISAGSVEVEGTITVTSGTPPFDITCEVNGIMATVNGDTMFTVTVPLLLGQNRLVATCTVVDSLADTTVCVDSIRVVREIVERVLLGVDGDDDFLVRIDIDATPPTVEVLGTVVDGSEAIVDLEAMAWDPVSGRIIVISNEDDGPLYKIDPADISGTDDIPAQFVGNTFSDDIEGIAVHPVTGELFGVDNTSHKLVKISLIDASVTEIGKLGFKDVEGLAFSLEPTPVLYGADSRTEKLITINLSNGRGTAVDIATTIGFPQVECLEFAPDGRLFGFSNKSTHEFVTIDPSNGAGTLFPTDGTDDLDIEGLTFMLPDTLFALNRASFKASRDGSLTSIPLSLPTEFKLEQNYPNPFNPSTKIGFTIPDRLAAGTRVQLRIYNLVGELVKVLIDAHAFPGRHEQEWDGRDDKGEKVSSGIYIYRLDADDFSQSTRMLLVK